MGLVAVDVGFGRGIRTTPSDIDPFSCISSFQALIGNDPAIAGNEWSVSWRFKPRTTNNNRFAIIKHTDVNGSVRRWETQIQTTAGGFRWRTFAHNGTMLVALNDIVQGVVDINAHTLGWSFSAAASRLYIDGVLANTIAGLGTVLAATATDYIWMQGGIAPPVAGQEIDLGEFALVGEVVDAAQFLDWHTNGAG